MKNLNEIRRAAGGVVNAIFQIAADRKVNGNDLPFIFKPATQIGPAVEDAGASVAEAGASTNAQMDASDVEFASQLLDVPSNELKRDIESIESAAIAVVRIVGRARLEGIAEGRAAMLAEVKAAGMDVSAFSA